MRILLVEDDTILGKTIQENLAKQNFVVGWQTNGTIALEDLLVEDYDLVILDIMLPGTDGLTILRSLRSENISTPVLLLTARDQIEDRVAGLDAGADDYLPKPFAFAELLARIRALLRRNSGNKNPLIKTQNLVIDTVSRTLKINDHVVELTNKEFSILEFLLYNANRVVSRLSIAEHVWDDNFDMMTNVVDVHIKNLRKKIDAAGGKNIIETKRGLGYLIKKED